jgi:hypothetical protein
VDKKLEQLEELRKNTALVNDLRGLLDEKRFTELSRSSTIKEATKLV